MTKMDEAPQSLEAIGERLRLTRDALGLNSRQLAELCEIPEKTLSAYLRGQNLIKPNVAVRIFRQFPHERIDFNWLYQGDMGGLSHDFALKIEQVATKVIHRRA